MVGSIFGWLGLLFAGMPVGFSLIFVALAFLILTNSTGINFAAQQMLGGSITSHCWLFHFLC